MEDRTRRTRAPRGLLIATASAAAASLLARHGGLAGAGVAIAIAACLSATSRRSGPWLLAVPAAFAGVEFAPPRGELPRPGPVWIEATVAARVQVDPIADETRVRLRPDATPHHALDCVLHGRAAARLLPGDRLRGPVTLDVAHGHDGPRPFLRGHATALHVETGPPSWARQTDACRLALQHSLLRWFDGEAGILLCHLVLGSGPAMPPHLSDAHRATGLTHLLAVSGAHASMLAMLLALAHTVVTGRRGLASRGFRWVCASVLLFYGAITGMEPPVFRALVGFFVVMLARAQGRRATVASVLAVPALLTTLVAPDDLLGASFNLSYAAVFGLSLSGAIDARSWRDRYLRAPIMASLWATLLTTPLTLWYFGQVAPWTIVATPLLAPVVAALLAGGLLVGALGACSVPGAGLLAAPIELLAHVYCRVVELTATLPGAPIHAPSAPTPLAIAALIGCGLVAVWARPGRAAVAALCLLASAPHFMPVSGGAPRLVMADVGHGQACIARLPNGRNAVIDCGSLGGSARPARAVANALGRRRTVDILVLTHAHADHVGAVDALGQRTRIALAITPTEMLATDVARRLRTGGTTVVGLAPGERWQAPHIEVTRPLLSDAAINDTSLWVRLDLDTFTALLTGDALEPAVRAWLRSDGASPADVLALPHHGAHHACVDALLDAIRPELALVSNRTANSWTPQAMAARRRGILVLETGRVGTIEVEADLSVRTARPLRLR